MSIPKCNRLNGLARKAMRRQRPANMSQPSSEGAMSSEDVLPFVSRDWEAVAASKRAYWARRYREEGWRATWDAADALIEDARRTIPRYPARPFAPAISRITSPSASFSPASTMRLPVAELL